jgi:hypothetical protein
MNRTQTASPLSDLVDFLQTTHHLQAHAGPEPGRVVASAAGGSVGVLLVGRRWYREAATASGGRELEPIHPRGMEWSVARAVAEWLEGAEGSER